MSTLRNLAAALVSAASSVGVDGGVVLSTGDILDLQGPNNDDGKSGVLAKDWKRTGEAFDVYVTGVAGTSPTCRFFSTSFAPKSSHFYTPSAAECAIVKANPNWLFEAEVFNMILPSAAGLCPAGRGVRSLNAPHRH